jgi:hypothetical protein
MFLSLFLLAADPDLASAASREVARQECRLRGAEKAITVCGRREGQRRYQVTDPEAPYDPRGRVEGVMTERMGWIGEGDTGIGSCSPVGPGGFTGCHVKAWKRTLQQKGWLVR